MSAKAKPFKVKPNKACWGPFGNKVMGTDLAETIVGGQWTDIIDAKAGDDLILAGDGNDFVRGGAGNDVVAGGRGDDWLDGGDGSDTYQVSGSKAGGWTSFEGFDWYADSGATGVDTVAAIGDGDVDIGFYRFDAKTGIEVIDGTGAAGTVRLLGSWHCNLLDFRGVTFVGTNIVIDGGAGDDKIYGTAGDDTIVGGRGDDKLDGGEGSDTYLVSGNKEDGWWSFEGYDSYNDTGVAGTDTIAAIGDGDVDIGLVKFDATSGIEIVDGSGATGLVRLLGTWKANTLDFSAATFVGDNIVIAGAGGNDAITGTAGDDRIAGGDGNDMLAGGGGFDRFILDEDLSASGNVDTITDFVVGEDLIDLSSEIFSALAGFGGLEEEAFVVGAAAADAGDRIIYDDATGELFYDEDGDGTAAQILIANLGPGLALSHFDFVIDGAIIIT